jgi:pyruvate formate-lyase/glycerol dehydratase family glycyl radical enzyme
MSERTQMLKRGIHYKSNVVKKVDAQGHPEATVRPGSKLCLDRARLMTESYKATEGEPEVIRRAKALAHVLEKTTIYIRDGELIVGNFESTPQSFSFYPEHGHKWLSQALEDGLRDLLDEKGKQEYKNIVQYWEGKSLAERTLAIVPRRLKDYLSYGPAYVSNLGHPQPGEILNVGKLFRLGLNGIIEQVEARLEELESKGLPAREYVEQRRNLEANLIALKAAIKFGERYRILARKLASAQKDEKRKEELNKIAEVCEMVPGNPPRTLHEALQSYWFCMLIAKQFEVRGQGSGHRLDLLLNPFYQKDKKEGRVTREEAQELLECLFIKFCEWGTLLDPGMSPHGVGISQLRDINIGGVTPKGDDATNEFSFIVLDAAQSLRLPEPSIALRYHSKISPDLVLKAIDVLRSSIGYPAFYNDSVIIPWLVSRGIPLEEARDYGIWSCVAPSIPGKNTGTCRPNAGSISLGKCLELALFQGKDKDSYTGKQLGAKTPDPKTFTCIEDVMDAFLTQVNFFAGKLVEVYDIIQLIHEQYLQRPFASTLIDGCIEKGKDCTSWQYNMLMGMLMGGSTNAANALAAIKKFVFDDKAITMEELVEACRKNFEGQEELRLKLLNEVPKFGNDCDYVDMLGRDVHIKGNEEAAKHRSMFGFPFLFDGGIVAGYYGLSLGCGALPDGKKDSEPFADAVISPAAGTDKNGPTAVLKSVSKVTPTYPHLLNQKFLPQFLEGENKEIFAQYLKSWADLGIWHVQFNVVCKDTLLDAQAHPEKHSDLIVRVAGFSAYFIDLTLEIQNDIIRRVEQGL